MLERLIELQKQFKKEEVTPLVIQYNSEVERLQSIGYDCELSNDMSYCIVRKSLINERINKKY